MNSFIISKNSILKKLNKEEIRKIVNRFKKPYKIYVNYKDLELFIRREFNREKALQIIRNIRLFSITIFIDYRNNEICIYIHPNNYIIFPIRKLLKFKNLYIINYE